MTRASSFPRTFVPGLVALASVLGGCRCKPDDPRRSSCPVPAAGSPATDRLEVARRGDAPVVDGRCDDPAYATAGVDLAGAAGKPTGALRVVHGGRDLFVCAERLPAGAHRLVLRFDVDHDRGGSPTAADLTFAVASDGSVSLSAFAAGTWQPVPLDAKEAGAAAGSAALEVRLPLARIGGHAHTGGLHVAVEDAGGGKLASWPSCGLPDAPASWADVVLGPLYDAGAAAASAFLDGQGGHLVVPPAPELDPEQLTIESWVRVVEGSCGTLVSSGPAHSYWVGLCGGVHFVRGGGEPLVGQLRLGEGWHHVAVTDDGAGRRSIFVDGQLDVASGGPSGRRTPRPAEAAGSALRIGSDAAAPSGMADLHGYVSGLRLWRRALPADELARVAFHAPGRGADGLVAHWPFAGGLADLAAAHHAGLVGDAGLAREAPARAAFVRPVAAPPSTARPVADSPRWNRVIPATATPATIDGQCVEYGMESRVELGSGQAGVHLLAGDDALYVCAGPLLGEAGKAAVTLLVATDGEAAPLQIELGPDGRAGLSRRGDAVPATGVVVKTWSAPRLDRSADRKGIAMPLWTSEAKLPLALLGSQRNAALRLGIIYRAELGKRVQYVWPADLDPQQPDHLVPVTLRDVIDEQVGHVQQGLTTVAEAWSGASTAPGGAAPRPSPTTNDLLAICPEPEDNPGAGLGYITVPEIKWPQVDGARPVVRAEGVLEGGHSGIHLSPEDMWMIHGSHDIDMHMTPAPASRWVAINGGRMVLETESAGFPDYARPAGGDHVVAVGRWSFDCGHNDNPKTELHPLFAMESDHLETRRLTSDGPPLRMLIAKVWMNSHPNPTYGNRFGFFQPLDAPFEFDLDLPAIGAGAPWMGFVRVLRGDPAHVSYTVQGTRAHFRVTAEQALGQSYFEIALGHLVHDDNLSGSELYTFTIDSIKAIHEHDAGLRGNGDWYLDAFIGGPWKTIWRGATISDGDDAYPVGHGLTFFRYRGAHVPLQITAYEDDSPRSDGGFCTVTLDTACMADDELTSGAWNLALPELSPGGTVKGEFCPVGDGTCANDQWKQGDWTVQYTLQRGGTMPGTLADDAFWTPRLRNEPDDSCVYPCWPGKVTVPGPGKPPVVYARDAFITERPLRRGTTELLGADADVYRLAVDDFASVDVAPLPAGLVVEQGKSEWFGYGIPQPIQDLLGPQSYRLTVKSKTGAAGDVPYRFEAKVRWRPLPPDGGEPRDPRPGTAPATVRAGRSMRLADPDHDPATEIYDGGRSLDAPWAWLHVAEDEDWYDVQAPLPAPRPAGQPACELDEPGGLRLDTFAPGGARIDLPAHGLTDAAYRGRIELDADQLRARFADGHVFVRVRADAGHRTAYLLRAVWTESSYLDPTTCKEEKDRRERRFRWILEKAKSRPVKVTLPRGPARPGGFTPPVIADLPIGASGGAAVLVPSADLLDLVVTAPEAQAIRTRLYDAHNVLLGESTPVAGDDPVAGVIAGGMIAHGRFRVAQLRPGESYLLQVVPAAASQALPASVRVGLSSASRDMLPR